MSTKIRSLATQFPIITLTGARQSGKTTLSQELFKDFEHVTLEDPAMRDLATHDMRSFLNRYNNHVIFDEAQRVPELFSALQGIVDDRNENGQFVLTGSQNFLLMKTISQSLAGRVAVMYLLPLSYSELTDAGLKPGSMDDWIWRGGYPRVYANGISPLDFYPSYIDTYVERDVRNELGVRKLSLFRRFLTQCATRVGEVVNYESLARDSGVDGKTAEEWLSILETSFIAFRLYPYYNNFGKRMVKSPKLYFYDTGLAANLLELESADEIMTSAYRGNLFENAVAVEIIKQYHARGRRPRLYYWRDYTKQEIDFIVEKGGRIRYAIEVKASASFDSHAFATMDKLSPVLGLTKEQRVVIYGGDEMYDTRFGRTMPISELNGLVA
ncbi:AAA family ATPase [Bifidobacterium felsineum]|uniref:AAA family ATPase n=2 Tax=Bifidobacterium felsineum TaxID=2045440 RepID=A0A2M9HIT6_9BIFI|nr:AAA family ATPase [Bifidobacterium felsineum]